MSSTKVLLIHCEETLICRYRQEKVLAQLILDVNRGKSCAELEAHVRHRFGEIVDSLPECGVVGKDVFVASLVAKVQAQGAPWHDLLAGVTIAGRAWQIVARRLLALTILEAFCGDLESSLERNERWPRFMFDAIRWTIREDQLASLARHGQPGRLPEEVLVWVGHVVERREEAARESFPTAVAKFRRWLADGGIDPFVEALLAGPTVLSLSRSCLRAIAEGESGARTELSDCLGAFERLEKAGATRPVHERVLTVRPLPSTFGSWVLLVILVVADVVSGFSRFVAMWLRVDVTPVNVLGFALSVVLLGSLAAGLMRSRPAAQLLVVFVVAMAAALVALELISIVYEFARPSGDPNEGRIELYTNFFTIPVLLWGAVGTALWIAVRRHTTEEAG